MNSLYFLESTFQFFVLPNFSYAKEAPFFLAVHLACSAEALYEFIQKSDQEYCHFSFSFCYVLLYNFSAFPFYLNSKGQRKVRKDGCGKEKHLQHYIYQKVRLCQI